MPTAKWNGTIIAQSDNTQIVEGNHYFPRTAVHTEYLKASDTTSHCPWKGSASYYSVEVDGKTNDDAAWYYAVPSDRAAHIKDHIAFWKGVDVSDA
ncbi:DUF427 domain-containing protein [Sphingorhabdus sp. Alg239-R122]|uniref:DUF427 domain-containing protein n=1 Tax=Sphingorhabdus sp. Alg239-R122 TaxID=2305989 RepID=UPI0013DBCC95|nr:DUF427 domain-containing protein [Sphingorhabdus sp. Alg239-R122]